MHVVRHSGPPSTAGPPTLAPARCATRRCAPRLPLRRAGAGGRGPGDPLCAGRALRHPEGRLGHLLLLLRATARPGRAVMVAEVPCNLASRHPPGQAVDNLPRYGGYARESTSARCRSRFPCLTPIVGQIIYYFIFGVLGACMQAPYKFKKSYGGGSVWGLPIVSTLRPVKPTIFT